MILKSIEAKNVLKYRSLRLTDLPSHGHIAVVGANEAGKTAIGETVCLGLFGRTFSLKPDDIERVIRWGEYSGSVTVTFSVGEGEEFSITREIDNTGGHKARLERPGEPKPLAEGVDAVEKAIRQIAGFTYQSFVDSFYLAQREMEVPHAKSATVKALIGVDRLEAVAHELETEISERAKVLETLEAKIDDNQRKIAVMNVDRARLGRLEAERDAKIEAASTAKAKSAELSTRATSIGKAATAFVQASRRFAQTTTGASCTLWRERERRLAKGLVLAAKASEVSGLDAQSPALTKTGTALKSIERGLDEYDKIRDLAGLYRERLAFLLDDFPTGQDADDAGKLAQRNAERNIEACYAHKRGRAQGDIDRTKSRRRTSLGLVVVLAELAMLTWTAWVAPDTSVGNLVYAAIALVAPSQDLALLLLSIASTVMTALFVGRYVRDTRTIRRLQSELSAIDDDEKNSRAEVDVIDAVDAAPLSDALEALGCIRNDLLRSAVVSFSQGEGTILVEPEALSAKLADINDGSAAAAASIVKAQERFVNRAESLQKEAIETRATAVQLGDKITEERDRLKKLEALERNITELATEVNKLRHRVVVCNLGRDLIEGSCRQIYARFHPELRRFVGRILPRLTEDRYEHLEIDDDLRVRVFCKEKNDFVGLAEISNGTHRQLMLCVRLALSQALIASSSKAAQFIFFDEPFAFFDERRMANAIDVMRKISPEITQVFLAAQHFDNLAAFDLCLNCDVKRDTLTASGGRRRNAR